MVEPVEPQANDDDGATPSTRAERLQLIAELTHSLELLERVNAAFALSLQKLTPKQEARLTRRSDWQGEGARNELEVGKQVIADLRKRVLDLKRFDDEGTPRP